MKNRLKCLSLAVLMMVMSVTMLSGCGPKKPAPEEAQAYVKAVLDLICTGDYDHTVELADVEEGKESEIRDLLISQVTESISSQSSLNEENAEKFAVFLVNAFKKANYTVGDAVAADDGGYDVTVSIRPLQLFTGIDEELNAVLEERVAAEPDKIMAMSEDEQTDYVMDILLELLDKKIADPKYDDAEEVIVHYGLIEGQNGVYGCSMEDGVKLGSKVFSSSGM